MHSLEELAQLADKAVRELEFPAQPELLYAPVKYTLEAGGKRLRPLLTLASCEMFCNDTDAAMSAAMGIEVFHNFTLLHDDIMDNADRRRGRETVHIKWNENVAILSGDAMVIYAYKLIAGSEPSKLAELLKIFNETALGVCEGQLYDMNFETTDNVSVEQYMDMIRLKTSVMIAGGAQMGAVAAGASEADTRKMYDFGIALGLGFQLQDDLLDTFGDPATFGKNIGGDIACGKKTFLLIKALEMADGKTKERLTGLLADRDISLAEKVEAVKDIYISTGAKELAEKMIDKYFSEAEAILDSISVSEERKGTVREIVAFLSGRRK